MSQWQNRTVIHTVPLGDLREHVCSPNCWCRPSVIEYEGGDSFLHNSMDGREAFETGERKAS